MYTCHIQKAKRDPGIVAVTVPTPAPARIGTSSSCRSNFRQALTLILSPTRLDHFRGCGRRDSLSRGPLPVARLRYEERARLSPATLGALAGKEHFPRHILISISRSRPPQYAKFRGDHFLVGLGNPAA